MPSASGGVYPTPSSTHHANEIPAFVDDSDSLDLNFETDSASDSTVSNQMGPGRIWGNWIYKAGVKLEKLLGQAAERLGMGPNVALDHINRKVDEIPALVDMDGASDSTVSNQMGPGRTMGNWISKAGGKLDKLAGMAAERLGMGPNAILDRIITRVARAQELWRMENHGYLLNHGFLQHRPIRMLLRPPRPLSSLVESVTELHSSFQTEFITAGVRSDCRKLTAFLRDENYLHQYLATYYIISLICALPDIRPVFVANGALKSIRQNCSYLKSLPKRHRERELLLAPSRRALALFSESQVLTEIKKGVQLSADANYNADAAHYRQMIQYSQTSESNVLAAFYLSKKTSNTSMADLIGPSALRCWVQQARCLDPLSRVIFSQLLNHLLWILMERSSFRLGRANAWKSLVIPFCQFLLEDDALEDPIQTSARDILCDRLSFILTESAGKPLFFILDEEIQEDLLGIMGRLSQTRSSTAKLSLAISYFADPFAIVYRDILREWWWQPGRAAFKANLCIVRAISPQRRKQLCRELIACAVRTYGFAADDSAQWTEATIRCFHTILRIATRYITCSDEILRVTAEDLRCCDDEARKGAKNLRKFLTIELKRYWESDIVDEGGHRKWTFRPYYPSVLYAMDWGPCWRTFYTRNVSFRLWLDPRYCSWFDAEYLSSWSSLEKPLVLERCGSGGKWICCRKHKDDHHGDNGSLTPGTVQFLTPSYELAIPEWVAAITKGPLYVLVGRNRTDGSRPIHWEEGGSD
ncbi:hypothetical protein JAAARDRAFT_192091 [Jaapia argillacea MUCL 33604]|uniref:Uncharacterized protein n=1 Tax=Jaapia argillacea MUCL 33604 TaxID=933084 RepID=A0A067PXM8_9AGAM|nr:hypothetical protein JAAARDRAFT_192091 [Jaapia argillacea MUCL 33604]